MAMRLQEVHPSLVHFPIALLPTSLVADAVGRLTGNDTLMEIGRRLMPAAAASVATAGVFGLIAQEEVQASEHAQEYLTTHRTLNLGLLGLTALMAQKRVRRQRPSLAYLLAGAAGAGVMAYSAYLGGHMVYEHGVGVAPADGVREGRAPELTRSNADEVLRVSGDSLRRALRHVKDDFSRGEVVPVLREEVSAVAGSSSPAEAGSAGG